MVKRFIANTFCACHANKTCGVSVWMRSVQFQFQFHFQSDSILQMKLRHISSSQVQPPVCVSVRTVHAAIHVTDPQAVTWLTLLEETVELHSE
jgi:hypothetical protein